LARLLGGVVLMQGRLGHQILGQMLVLGTSEVAVAGAAVVVAATTRQRNAVAQVALRTAAPAIAGHVLLQKEEKRIERRETLAAERERKCEERSRTIEERGQAVGKREIELEARRIALEGEHRELQLALERLSTRLPSREGADSVKPPPAANEPVAPQQ